MSEQKDPLTISLKQQKAAAELGFDWPDAEGAWAKLREELEELRAASTIPQYEHELGDVFFTLINLSRFLDVDPKRSLLKASARFESRFAYVKQRLAESHEEVPLEQMELWWQEAKSGE